MPTKIISISVTLTDKKEGIDAKNAYKNVFPEALHKVLIKSCNIWIGQCDC